MFNKKSRVAVISTIIICLCAIFNIIYQETVFASEGRNSVASTVIVEKYSISTDTIIPGEKFDLTLTLKNISKNAVRSLLVNLTIPDGVIPEYGTVSQVVLPNINANGSTDISFSFKASQYLSSEYIDFGVSAVSDEVSNYIVVRVPVGAEVPFQIISQNTPDMLAVGEKAVSNITFKTIGSDKVDNVVCQIKTGDKIIGSSSVGTIISGTTKNQGVAFSINEEGSHDIVIEIAYTNSDGDECVMNVGNATVTVEKAGTNISGTESSDDNSEKNDTTSLIMVLVSLLFIILALFFILRIVKNNKER